MEPLYNVTLYYVIFPHARIFSFIIFVKKPSLQRRFPTTSFRYNAVFRNAPTIFFTIKKTSLQRHFTTTFLLLLQPLSPKARDLKTARQNQSCIEQSSTKGQSRHADLNGPRVESRASLPDDHGFFLIGII